MEINLRPASMEDAALLFDWANEKEVRRNSFCQEPIAYEDHMEWLSRKLKEESSHVYIAMSGGVPVGQIRLDVKEGGAWIDYSVDKNLRGRGLGTVMVNAAERTVVRNKLAGNLRAQVKRDNGASARVFEKCGFVKREEKAEYLEYEKRVSGTADILICTHKSWNVENAEKFREEQTGRYEVEIYTEKEQLSRENVERLRPSYIFFPHWSYIIPGEIYENYTCIVFHMTDLPFGRGGSPLQNLIVRGYESTKISAIRVDAGLDTGDVYCKEELELWGTADEILRRASDIIFTRMIPKILREKPKPVKQEGEAVSFRRRKPEDGRLTGGMDSRTIYDYIRMMDGEGYPPAYLEFGEYRVAFSKAKLKDGRLTASAEFIRNERENKA